MHWDGPQLWPTGPHEQFSAVLDSADGADFAPPRQARDVFAELETRLDGLRRQLKDLLGGPVAEVNEALRASQVAPLGPDEEPGQNRAS